MVLPKKIIKKILQYTGYEIKRILPKKSYAFEYIEEIEAAIALVEKHTMLSPLKLGTLYEQVIFCEKNKIEGAFVECGVWKGGAVGVMAIANLKHGEERRRIFLFDAFDDICQPDAEIDGKLAIEDVELLLGKKVNDLSGEITPIKGIYDYFGGHGTIEICKNLLVDKINYEKGKINFCKGWFEQSMDQYAKSIDKIAILRLDADWYSSTKTCLDALFDKVVVGGFIIIDDYGRYEGCKKAVDEFFEKRGIRPFMSYSDYEHGECRYFIK